MNELYYIRQYGDSQQLGVKILAILGGENAQSILEMLRIHSIF